MKIKGEGSSGDGGRERGVAYMRKKWVWLGRQRTRVSKSEKRRGKGYGKCSKRMGKWRSEMGGE